MLQRHPFRRTPIAGIRPDSSGPGFQRIVIQPHLLGDFTHARAQHPSMFGWIESAWAKRDGGKSLVLEVTVPVNVVATVHVPARAGEKVFEGDELVDRAPGVKLLERSDAGAVLEVGWGSYRFVAK